MKFRSTSIAAALGAAVGLGSFGPANADTNLVVVSWGGAYTKSQQLAYHEPYMTRDHRLRRD